MSGKKKNNLLPRPARIALGYVAAATAWIVTSDSLVNFLAGDAVAYTRIQTWKGAGFVLVTGLALYALLRLGPAGDETSQQQDLPTPRHRAVLLGLTFLMLAAVIVGFGIIGYRHQSEIFKEHKYLQQAAIAKLKAGQIERWVDWHRQDAELLRNDPDLIEAAHLLRQGQKDKSLPRLRKHFDGLLRTGRWDGVGLYSADGSPLLLTGGADVPDEAHKKIITATLAEGKIRLNDLHAMDKAGKQFHIDFLVPFYDDAGETQPAGVIILSAAPYTSLFEMVRSWPVHSDTSETYLVRREGDEVVFLSPLRHAEYKPLDLRRPLSDESLSAGQAVRRGEGIFEGRDYRGAAVIAAYRPIAGTAWHIVAETDTEEVMQPLRQHAGLVAAIVLLGLCVSGLFVAYLWRSQQTAFAVVQQRGREEREALVRHFDSLFQQARDIILLIDPEGRIVQANNAAADTYGYSLEEFRNLTIRDLRAPETHGSFEHDFRAADNPEGVLFETVHRRKGGSSFPVEVSARAVDIRGKRYRQSFIRDISERRRAEETVRSQLDELRRWYEVTLDREGRIGELKAEVNALRQRLGEPPRYGLSQEAGPTAASAGRHDSDRHQP